jgi:hypothetical protein
MPLYDYILEGVQNSGYFYNQQRDVSFERYLQKLQEAARELWESYRNPTVNIDYSRSSIQASYLLRYYPHYAYMALQICKILHERNLFNDIINENLSACFFGAGPCSELSGFIKFLSRHYPNTRTVIANVYDIASRHWTPSRVITQNFIIPNLWEGELDLQPNYLDLCQSDSLNTISETIQGSQLFIFQNCLNEIYNLDSVQVNLDYLFNTVPANSLIIIIDLYNYNQNFTIIKQIEDRVINRHDFAIYRPETLKIKSYPSLPTIIQENLLDGSSGLIPRKNDIDCLLIALWKVNHEQYILNDIVF